MTTVAPQTRYATSGDVSIAYQVVGEGPRDLILAPGFVSHAEVMWENPDLARVLERLASFSRLIVFDKREQGLSDRVGRPPTIEEMVDDMGAVLDARGLGARRAVGISEGGAMSLAFAATHPDRCTHLVIWVVAREAHGTPGTRLASAPRRSRVGPRSSAAIGGTGGARSVRAQPRQRPRTVRWWAHLLRSGTSPRAPPR